MQFRTDNPIQFKDTNLFKPIQLGSIELKHRVVLAPLTRGRSDNYTPTAQMIEYYNQRSQKPGTLIITEGTFISPESGGIKVAPGIFTQEQIEAWKPIHKKIHDNGSFSFQQLWNLGWQSWPGVLANDGLKFVGASDDNYMDETSKQAALEVGNPIHGLTIPEIKEHVGNYVKAAENSLEAGADGVEIHSCNGYLLNQFLDTNSNKRTDEYGGSIENRSRFILEIIDSVIDAIGAFKIGVRFSPFGVYGNMNGDKNPMMIELYSYIFDQLEKRAQDGKRITYIHIVEPRVTSFVDDEGVNESQGSNEFIYKFWKGLVIRAGNYALNPEIALNDITNHPNTLLAYGRTFISNPDLPERLEKGLPLTKYNRETFYTPGEEGYIDYPRYSDMEQHEKWCII
ncbi:NADPH dehydrogenase 3 [Wickerhamomyces ciferrii]|uniref:NADPH dehydrogenase 3 n=1 Tax=Wickerhamomyces ciferrii (strain ATCC 14091 / BCRC 22168 / CBS 111 / JCM 3599 / NBRC 0793 / NRRL Y-1031 F-60-10) TaxID=1206466 RepID=K0KPW6_WICCF|nr:NADPH dehydrogenase 3 [Wickerhamomyces ciferrii]CCH43469.1 NADPH dehydrogenase 3 [Wickerhamomyces ciferrii]